MSFATDILVGLACASASNIRELQRRLDYVLVTNAGRVESLPHKTFA
jgi:IMP dehydrogenase